MATDSRTGSVINKDFVISETIDEETIIINLNSGSYFSLRHSGVPIWKLLQSPVSVTAIVSDIVRDFDVEANHANSDVEALIGHLSEEGLVSTVSPGESTGAALTSATPALRRPYVAPSLEKFTDMEAMLLLDPIHDVDEAGWPQLPQQAMVRPVNAE